VEGLEARRVRPSALRRGAAARCHAVRSVADRGGVVVNRLSYARQSEPEKFYAEVIPALVEAGGDLRKASARLGVPFSTLSRWVAMDDRLLEARPKVKRGWAGWRPESRARGGGRSRKRRENKGVEKKDEGGTI
jgi:hypothetical protein